MTTIMGVYAYGSSPYEFLLNRASPNRLGGLPTELMLAVCSYLSVADICRFRAVSRQFLALVSLREIWTQALRDILVLKHLPILEANFLSLATEELVRTTIRLARQDRDFGHAGKTMRLICDWAGLSVPGWDEKSPTLLPGGQHVAVLCPSKKRLLVRGTCSDESFSDLLPSLEGTSVRYAEKWLAAPRTQDTLSIAVCAIGEGITGTGGSVRLFQYNLQTKAAAQEAVIATHTERCSFYTTLNHDVLAVMRSNPGMEMPLWTVFLYDLKTGRQAEVQLKDTLMGTPDNLALPRGISLLSPQELIVSIGDLSPVYPMPDLRAPEPENVDAHMPFVEPEAPELTAAIAAVQGNGGAYIESIIVPPPWRRTGSGLTKGFLQWNQGTVTIAKLSDKLLQNLPVYRSQRPSAYDEPDKPSLMRALRCPARGTFALTNTRGDESPECTIGVYKVHVEDAGAANIRLGRENCYEPLTWSPIKLPDALRQDEVVWRMDLDEPSGRILLEVGGMVPFIGNSRLMVLEV